MKKQLFTALSALVLGTGVAQTQFLEKTCYRGAFAPAPTPMWTDGWTEWNPQSKVYAATNYTIPGTTSGTVTTISANTTWTTGTVVHLIGLVFVTNNAELTIQPGVIIRSNPGITSALIITRGAKIHAVGTAAQPIVFTSNEDAGDRLPGDCGGLIVLGKATTNAPNGESDIEGFAGDPNGYGKHGGGTTPDDNDNSGELKYVRIEFAGKEYTPNNELNSLTMGSVGRGTQIDYVQTSFGNDDAFEWFGGTVNCKHLVAYRCTDDDFDCDNGFRGTVQFALGIRDPELADFASGGASEGFECDNDAGGTTATPVTGAVFSNVTHIGPAAIAAVEGGVVHANHARALRLRRNSAMKIVNSVFIGHRVGGLFIDGAASQTQAANGDLAFANNILAAAGTAGDNAVVNPTVNMNGSTNTITTGAWFAANNNYTVASSAGIVTAIGYSADYRPAANSPALSNVSFTNTHIAAVTGTAGNSVSATIPASLCLGSDGAALTTQTFAPATNIASGYCSLSWSASSGITISNASAVNPVFSVGTIGSFTVTLTVDNGAGTVTQPLSISTTTCLDVSIAESKFTLGHVSLYPNPASSDEVTVNVTAEKAGSLSISVYDVTGKTVAAPVVNGSLISGENKFTINTSELQNGIYFVTLNNANGKGTVKLIVNK
ncbi:MAG: T9SS type A sorting domain-containing protein [Bacteroidetes bacterium]|nr:T9SS type A sorting domain-containing protein [Bacteroidota bacterium]